MAVDIVALYFCRLFWAPVDEGDRLVSLRVFVDSDTVGVRQQARSALRTGLKRSVDSSGRYAKSIDGNE